MWLIRVSDQTLVEFAESGNVPGQYAILSHTWSTDEVTFGQFRSRHSTTHGNEANRVSEIADNRFAKIDGTCEQARKDGLAYAWIDTCCIDKSSSAELSEAINSMFSWYRNAAVCYVLLSDVTAGHRRNFTPTNYHAKYSEYLKKTGDVLGQSRWVTRGWTLQEVLAPTNVEFFDSGWEGMGSKLELLNTLATLTGIDPAALEDSNTIPSFSVAQRMSWAAGRVTTRSEDQAYSLLGLFGVAMPLLYGEGRRAFRRLQETIISQSTDHSIFAWQPYRSEDNTSLLAPHPFGFRRAGDIQTVSHPARDESLDLGSHVLRVRLPTILDGDTLIVQLNCHHERPGNVRKPMMMRLQRISDPNSRRIVCRPDSVLHMEGHDPYIIDSANMEWQDLEIVRERQEGTIVTVEIECLDGLQLTPSSVGAETSSAPSINEALSDLPRQGVAAGSIVCELERSPYEDHRGTESRIVAVTDPQTGSSSSFWFRQVFEGRYAFAPLDLCWLHEFRADLATTPEEIKTAESRASRDEAYMLLPGDKDRRSVCARAFVSGDARLIRIWKA